jgi:hypothetical protein
MPPSIKQSSSKQTTVAHRCTQSHTHNNIASLILSNFSVLAASGITVTLLDEVADPAPNAFLALRVFAEDRLAVLNFNGRRVDVEVWHIEVDVGAVDSVVAKAERRHRRACVAEQRLGLGESLGCRSHGGGVAEERVHVFQAHVGSFGVNEPN